MVAAKNRKIYYIVEPIGWSINWDGKYITENIKRVFKHPAKVLKISKIRLSRIQNQILHFGSRSTYLPYNHEYINKNNKIIMTWFHGTDEDIEYIRLLPKISKDLSVIHTSCTITRDQLIRWGAAHEKIKIIPIGVDIDLFNSMKKYNKKDIRKGLGIPDNVTCIGSFQKDGDGWGEGNSPKMIKGPDIFCDVIEKLNKRYPVFVLLTGPARGYVKNRLDKAGIPFKHFYLKNYLNIVKFYKALDLYLISSRAEGGPKALLESFASGVPLVSTDVGMVHDIAQNGSNALVSEADQIESLVNNCRRVIEDYDLKSRLISGGYKTVKDFDWKIIAGRYYREIYSKLF